MMVDKYCEGCGVKLQDENVLGEDPGSVYFCKTTYKGNIVVKQECEMYENINEMLNKVRICGKTIKDIWNDVIF